MPKLQPIQAVTYNPANGQDLSTRIAPPYDVLDEGPKRALLEKDPNNIVAIDLPVTPPKTVGPDAAYEQAGDLYREWLENGVLVQNDQPAVYAYEQVYTVNARTLRRRGLFTALGTEPFNRRGGGIFRHEMTIEGGINDRYKLMQACKAQLSPVFGIFSDAKAKVANLLSEAFDKREPDFTGITAHDGVEHRLWQVAEPQTLKALQEHFETTDVFIADGHHRYTTALKFGEDNPQLTNGKTCLFVLVAAEDEGMIVLPTHRIVTGMKNFSIDRLMEATEPWREKIGLQLEATELGHESLDKLAGDLIQRKHHAMGLYHHNTGKLFTLRFDREDPLATLLPDKPAVWRKLDVAILQHALVEQILQPAFAPKGETLGYKYTAELGEVRKLADADANRLGIIMQPTPLESVMGVSLEDEVMPAKSTFFYPKLATGLIVHPLA